MTNEIRQETAAVHTPGPWEIRHDNGLVTDAGGHPVAFMPISTRGLAYHAANARLIAAAPDLLEALDEALTELADSHPCDWAEDDACEEGGGSESHSRLRQISAAIKKARGED